MPRENGQFVFNESEFRRWARTDRQLTSAMLDIGRRGMRFAETISPRESGDYGQSWNVDARPGRTRVRVRISNSAPHALQVEFGTEDTPAHRVLGKTMDYLRSIS